MPRYSSRLLNTIEQHVNRAAYFRRYIGEYLNLWRKRKLIRTVHLTPEQKKRIIQLWKTNYGKRIPLFWHRLYASYTGIVDVNYFPEVFYSTVLERKYNDPYLALSSENKAQMDLLLRLPTESKSSVVPMLFYKTCGAFFNSIHELITLDQAEQILSSCGHCVIKASMDTDSGRDVRVLDMIDGIDKKSGLSTKDILKLFHEDFLVQPFFEVHDVLKKINPTSVCTMRIVTYLINGKAYHSPLALRIGAVGADVDNIHAGGMGVGLDDDGFLNEVAFSEFGEKIYAYPGSGVVFKGIQIPGVRDAIQMVEKCHLLIPRLTFISWDVTIGPDCKPVIIEINTRNQAVWLSQMVNGKSFFGDNTEFMIRQLRR